AQAYLKAGILDTAYIYAKELVTSPDPLNKEFGYRVLTSPGIRETLPPDTLAEYLFRYDDILGQQRDANMEEAAIIQNSLYNYDVHDRARQIAEKERDSLELWLALAVALASGLGLMIVLPMLKKEKRLNKISRLVAKRDILRSMFPSGGSASTQHGSDGKSPVSTGETLLTEVANMSINEGREKLREEMLRLCELNRTNGLDYLVPERISSSPAYIEIRERISSGKKIDEDDPLWREIEKVVSACFPDFRRRLHLLSEGKLTVAEERTAMLVKCGFGATDMGKAFGRVKGTMVTRRASISRKIFDEVKGSHLVDELIRVL
ncbi:MAG: hypothetical protein K2H76_02805, partial [Muribaculaceae bacterium]|nr:hypothetical protein [Muribaculaceae bacterium]